MNKCKDALNRKQFLKKPALHFEVLSFIFKTPLYIILEKNRGGAADRNVGIGAAIAFSILMTIYAILNYVIFVQKLLQPCLKEYILCIFPHFCISMLMGTIILFLGITMKSLPELLLLCIQINVGIIVYTILMVSVQRHVLIEVKNMILNKNIS